MNSPFPSGCHNLIIRPHPTDTLSNIAHITAFFKEFYEVHNPDFYMSDNSRTGFYLLLSMVEQAAEFEATRLSDAPEELVAACNKAPLPETSREALENIMKQVFK